MGEVRRAWSSTWAALSSLNGAAWKDERLEAGTSFFSTGEEDWAGEPWSLERARVRWKSREPGRECGFGAVERGRTGKGKTSGSSVRTDDWMGVVDITELASFEGRLMLLREAWLDAAALGTMAGEEMEADGVGGVGPF